MTHPTLLVPVRRWNRRSEAYMDTKTPGIVYGSGASVLYGTARLPFRGESEGNISVYGSQREVCKSKKRRGGRLRTFVKKHFCCCFRKVSKSNSVRHAFASPANEDNHTMYIHRSKEDHEKDMYIQHLIANKGRNQCFTYPILCDDISVAERNPNGQHELDNGADHMKTYERSVRRHNKQRSPGHSLSSSVERKTSVPCYHWSSDADAGEDVDETVGKVLSKHSGLGSSTQEIENNPLSEDDNPDTQSKIVGSDAQNTLVGEMKNVVHAVSAQLNQNFYKKNRAVPRPSVRERSLLLCLQKYKQIKCVIQDKCDCPCSSVSQKYLFGRNHPFSNQQMQRVQMMNEVSQNEFCYPRYSERSVRMATLRDCTKVQLSGYGQEELAQAGWFFKGRILTTFCCGMEIPTTPVGTPHSIHLGLSPQCPFILGLQNVAPDSNSDSQRTEVPQGGLQTSGEEATLNFSIPVQATDEGCEHSDFSALSYALNVDGYILDAPYQESEPSSHWMMAGADAAVSQPDASYYASLVTSRTQLPPEQLQEYPGNRQQYLAQQELENSAQTSQSQQTAAGHLAMRSNPANPLGLTRLTRDSILEVGRQSPPDPGVFPLIDQLNIDGYGDSEHEPRFRQFGFPTIRVYTFEGWPVHHLQTPNMLADAGFFYAGYGDSVICYSCGIGVRNWLPTDNVWIEHARLWPRCVFVRSIQGQHFIDAAREMKRNERRPTYQEVRLEANRRRQAAEGASGEGEDAPIRALRDDSDDERVHILCKMCYAQEMNMILMPCRHLAVCNRCISQVHSCPVCRADVNSSMQANFP